MNPSKRHIVHTNHPPSVPKLDKEQWCSAESIEDIRYMLPSVFMSGLCSLMQQIIRQQRDGSNTLKLQEKNNV